MDNNVPGRGPIVCIAVALLIWLAFWLYTLHSIYG